jgi:hypothetical protein
MAKRTKTTKTKERKLNLPGFGAEASLGPTRSRYRGSTVFGGPASRAGAGLVPQLGFQPQLGGDVGEYLRCRANGGGELVCRFFAGLPPFTIGGLFF